MKYVLTGEENWADEFDVHFFEVLDERDKAIYDSANKILESWIGYYGFGTNEYFDDFEFLGWELIPINDNEYEVIKIDNMKPAAFKLKCFKFLNKEQQALDKGESNIEDEA